MTPILSRRPVKLSKKFTGFALLHSFLAITAFAAPEAGRVVGPSVLPDKNCKGGQ